MLLLYLAEGRERSAGEQDNPFELLVEEEIVEAPQRPVLPEGVRSKVGVVRVDVAVNQVDLLIQEKNFINLFLEISHLERVFMNIINPWRKEKSLCLNRTLE